MKDSIRQSVPDAIAAILLDRVMSGDLAPGSPLREAELAGEFDTSRNTLRAALLQLEHDGVIRRNAHRGCRVVDPGRVQIEAMMRFRKAVEPGAVRWLVRLVAGGTSGQPLADVGRVASELAAAATAGDWRTYGELDLRFHADLCLAAGGEALRAAFERSVRPLYVHLLAADVAWRSEDAPQHVDEHGRLVELIAAGNERDALWLIDTHLKDAERAALERTEDRNA